MKHLFILSAAFLFLLFSCSKKGDNPKPYYENTPLHKVIDGKYIMVVGDTTLDVKYLQFDTTKDCSKEVFNEAIETVSQQTGINRVYVTGKTLTMRFSRNSNVSPSRNSLTRESNLYKEVYKPWKWQGCLTIKKENSFLTEDEFNKAININVRALFTGEEAKVVSKTIVGDVMTVVYELTKGSDNSAIYYEVKANTPITFKSEYLVDCKIPVYAEQGKFVPLAPGYTTYAKKDLGSGVTSYSLEIYNEWVTAALSNYVATRYFVNEVYPVIK